MLNDVQRAVVSYVETPEHSEQMEGVVGMLRKIQGTLQMLELYGAQIVSELVIRVSPETSALGGVVEEYWLRADARQIRQVRALLEGAPPPAEEQAKASGFKCSNCKRPVHEEESFCANCGMRFSE